MSSAGAALLAAISYIERRSDRARSRSFAIFSNAVSLASSASLCALETSHSWAFLRRTNSRSARTSFSTLRRRAASVTQWMNDLFSGDIREADFLGAVAAWQGHLMANGSPAEQAKNNSEEQFSMGDFKDAFMDVVIDAKDASNSIATRCSRASASSERRSRCLPRWFGSNFKALRAESTKRALRYETH
jgi:hypothetical protein